MQWHVSISEKENGNGTLEKPFQNISNAVSVAQAGDIILVHEGVYREWVSPIRGGNNDNERITFKPYCNDKVVITGSEIIKDWREIENNVWKTIIPNSFFGGYNPYKVFLDGDWLLNKAKYHTGEVYLNGKSLYEMETLENVLSPTPIIGATEAATPTDQEGSTYVWYCETDDVNTTIYANFHGYNPCENMVEINVRPFCFWPEKIGINYITVSGFTMKQAATQWAPPTALQEGLIGAHWSKGWIIENNIISDSKCSGISLGKEEFTGQNEWTRLGFKHGTQREREVVLRALKKDWNKETVGSHIVRGNTIFNCEQAGICGHLGAIFSEIYDNHIYCIHEKRLFDGSEIAGIKLHAAIDTVIENNHIHDAFRGIWLDWQAQGTRVSKNIFYNNIIEDLFIEVSHGPYIVDNNILLSKTSLRDASQGGAFIHNLFTGDMVHFDVKNRFTPYHIPHETGILGFMTIMGGDDRFYNNVFVKGIDSEEQSGLHMYDVHPSKDERWYQNCKILLDYDKVSFPMYCGGNVYINGAKPYRAETNSLEVTNTSCKLELKQENDGLYLYFDYGKWLANVKTELISSDNLGITIQVETFFEHPKGGRICIAEDFSGTLRSANCPTPGPIQNISQGLQKVKVAKEMSNQEKSRVKSRGRFS